MIYNLTYTKPPSGPPRAQFRLGALQVDLADGGKPKQVNVPELPPLPPGVRAVEVKPPPAKVKVKPPPAKPPPVESTEAKAPAEDATPTVRRNKE